jgi:flagellar biosynthetic protein FliR
MTFTEAQLASWLASVFWPFVRISGLLISAPVFNNRQLNARIKISLALLITILVAPLLPAVPVVEVFSYEAFMIAFQQLAIGLVMGFTLQLAFGTLVIAGQAVAHMMHLGMAQMVDPQNGVNVPTIATFYVIFAMLLTLSLDIHLVFIQMLVDSFTVMPVSVDGVTRNTAWDLVGWGTKMFQIGLLIALPVKGTLLLVNIVLGIMSRAAPQLHLFAIGQPVIIASGLILIMVSLSSALGAFTYFVDETLLFVKNVLLVGR